MKRILPAVAMLVLGVSSSAHAQLCSGMGSFDGAPVQFGSGMAFTTGVNMFGGSVAGGSDSLYAGLAFGYQRYSDYSLHATSLGGMVGSDQAVSGRVHVCPTGTFSYLMGPDAAGVKVRTTAISPGASVGFVVSETDHVSIIPTFGVSLDYARTRVKVSGIESASVSDTSGSASVGVGVLINRRTAIVPAIVFPLARAGADPIFGVAVACNLAR